MQTVEDEPIETIHLYVVRETEKKPFTALPLLAAFLCLVGIVALTIYSGEHPYFEHETLTVPAILLPPTTMSVSEQIGPTGRKTYPATQAHGILTLTNGSVIAQTLPSGLIFTGNDGVEVVTDSSVFVPAGSAEGYGFATVSAHTVIGGKQGNISAYDIDRVEGSSIYIRNLRAFDGGADAYTSIFVTPQDRQNALTFARYFLLQQRPLGLLVRPCTESIHISKILILTWTCQFATYHVPSYMKVLSAHIHSNVVFVAVVFIPRPRIIVTK